MNLSQAASWLEVEAGSFRDPDGRVFYGPGGRVLRGLSEEGAHAWHQLEGTSLFHRLTERGSLIPTRVAPDLGPATFGWATVLEHDRVPFVSYPFEWTFSMLRDAAVLHLEVVFDALSAGMSTKDGSAYNVQWRGRFPVFVDVSSFSPFAGGPWPGYRQFCETFLNPLLLQAYRGVNFQPWLRGRLEGVSTNDARRLLTGWDILRRGVLKHVVLQDLLQQCSGDHGAEAARAALAESGFDTGVARTAVQGLLRLVTDLEWQPRSSTWSRYAEERPYADEDLRRKTAFVEEAVRAPAPRLAWDLGCNDGRFARVAAAHAGHVVAMDADHPTVERLYRSLKEGGERNILPLVVDIAEPSPGIGWRGRERRPLDERGGPDVVLCLALVHHLAITANVPLEEIVAWLHALGGRVVIEFVEREDPMVRRLLANKSIVHAEYGRARFEALLARRFAVRRRLELPAGTRTLYEADPR